MSDESWSIRNDQDAEWAIKRIKEAQADTEKWAAWYKAKADAVAKQNQRTVDYLTMELRRYFDRQPHHITKTGIEKYALPGGEMVWKPAGYTYKRDEDVLLAWCKENRPEAVKVSESVDWAMLKAGIAKDGVLPAGVMPEPADPSFSVNIKEEE